MFKPKNLLTLVLCLSLTLLCSTAFAGDMQSTLLKKLPYTTNSLTRAEFVSMLTTAAELPAPKGNISIPQDVPTNAWYSKDLQAALAAGVIHGTNSATISPDQNITQAQAAVMISRVLGVPSVPAPGVPADAVPSDHWAYVPLTWLVKDGVMASPVNPENSLSPAAGAALLEKLFGTAKEAKDIAQKSQTAQSNIKTMRTSGTMTMSMQANSNVAAQGMPANMKLQGQVTQDINMDQGIYQQFTMNIVGLPQPMPAMQMEQYMVSSGMYMKMKNPLSGEEKWAKMPVGSMPDFTLLLKQKANSILPKELDQYFHYRLLGEKQVGQDTFYQLAFYGKIDDLNQFINLLGGQIPPELIKQVSQTGKLVSSINMVGTMTVNKANFLSDSFNATMTITFADQFQGQPFPLKSMSADLNFQYKDYNNAVEVKLPAEAANAETITPVQPQ